MQDFIIEEYLKHSKIPVTEKIRELVKALFDQCYELPEEVANLRPSYRNFISVTSWGGDTVNAHIASLSALNSKHGCFTDAYKFIESHYNYSSNDVLHILIEEIGSGNVIPGFGNPVIKERDPRCDKIGAAFIEAFSGPIANKAISYLNANIKAFNSIKESSIQENLVFWNAFIAYTLGLSVHHASLIFILASQIRYVNEISKPQRKELI